MEENIQYEKKAKKIKQKKKRKFFKEWFYL